MSHWWDEPDVREPEPETVRLVVTDHAVDTSGEVAAELTRADVERLVEGFTSLAAALPRAELVSTG